MPYMLNYLLVRVNSFCKRISLFTHLLYIRYLAVIDCEYYTDFAELRIK